MYSIFPLLDTQTLSLAVPPDITYLSRKFCISLCAAGGLDGEFSAFFHSHPGVCMLSATPLPFSRTVKPFYFITYRKGEAHRIMLFFFQCPKPLGAYLMAVLPEAGDSGEMGLGRWEQLDGGHLPGLEPLSFFLFRYLYGPFQQ